jgi:GNAT superfamily N-acetyltransferase
VDLGVRDLDQSDLHAARELLARAFVDEPYVVMLHGDDPEARRAALEARYAAEPPDRHTLALGAYAGNTLAAVLLGSVPGTCLGCERNEDTDPWSVAVAEVHAGMPAHLRVGRFGVDPAYRGSGAGAGLLHAAVGRAREQGVTTVLECQTHRIGYYERRGFAVVARVPDPSGDPGAVLVRT